MRRYKSKMVIFMIFILIWGIIVPGFGGQTVLAAELEDIEYNPLIGDEVQVAPNFQISEGAAPSLAEGKLIFRIEEPYVSTDKLVIPEGATTTVDVDGELKTITINANGEILLDGAPIASVNRINNGEAGPLQIDLSTPLPNGNFEQVGHTGYVPDWDIYPNEHVTYETYQPIILGELASRTQGRPYTQISDSGPPYTVSGPDYTYITDVRYDGTGGRPNYEGSESTQFDIRDINNLYRGVFIANDPNDDEPESSNYLKLGFQRGLVNDSTPSAQTSAFAVQATSSAFYANAGDQLYFDWRARTTSNTSTHDDYEVYGFLLDANTEEVVSLLMYGRGFDQYWTTTNGTVDETGNYKFRFVAGSFDRTGGRALGAELRINNVRVVSSQVSTEVVEAIAQLVYYQNTEYSGDRPVNIELTDANNGSVELVDSELVIKMNTQEEASAELTSDLEIVGPEDGELIYNPMQKGIAGTTQPGSSVDVVVTSPEGHIVYNGPANVEEDGAWSIELADDLIRGEYTIEATASKGGATSDVEVTNFTFVDYAELEDYYNEVKDLVESEYQSGWDSDSSDRDPAFSEALQNAKDILDEIANAGGSNPSQAAIDQALSELQNAKDGLVRVSPVEQFASFEHGSNELVIEFDKSVVFANLENTTDGFTVTVGEGEHERQLTVTNAVANGANVILTVDEELDSDVKVTVAYNEELAGSNLIGAEEDNPGPVRDFQGDFPATDEFGAALQIEGTTGNTDDSTPSFNGTVDGEVDSVKVDIVDADGNVVTEILAVVNKEDGTWTVSDSEWTGLEPLDSGDYQVVVTATKEGRSAVVKEEVFTVVDKSVLQEVFDEVVQFEENDYRSGWDDFVRELENAQQVINNPTASQDEVDQALEDLRVAREGLEKHAPIAEDAKFLHGHGEIIVEFGKNVTFIDENADLTAGFTVTVDGQLVEVIAVERIGLDQEGKSNQLKLTLADGTQLSSDADIQVLYDEEAGSSNFIGDEENGTAVANFEFAAYDSFGQALQIEGPNGITNDTTPAIRGTVDPDADHAVITIIAPDGERMVVNQDDLIINPDGTWSYQVLEKLEPGEYQVEVTSSQEGRTDVTKYHSFIVVDKESLIQLEEGIANKGLQDSAYTGDSWNDFDQALQHARNVLSDPEASQDEVDQALANLEEAYKNLVYKQGLKEEVAQSETLDEAHYSKESWARYVQALEAAKQVLNNPASTQEEIDQARADLEAARQALTVDKTALQEAVDYAKGLNNSDYTSKSWERYQEALSRALDVLNDPNATQLEIDQALAELIKASEGLEEYKELPNTATALFNYMFLGLGLLFVGLTFLLLRKRKRRVNVQ
ncbi:LPXTG cell wall anchor domain-containing protein [Alkalihalobacillus hemicellulosilyticus]|uniref:Uncharacterized protein n=1 Tax=Halalkalibacter hemicellulosilyticusJCM 9152 TaxID=1236971 RepID=W4QGZ6_9BACI|nr:Ig-like domain-containing protein [Halalkalibacter hemicellulosilyticus]GAE31380.1 hypothetical protein JCM9152_2846 [Halalkalibacter hemicellulosilyticusJCM 9152]